MKCANHPEIDAVGVCVNCGRAVCSECRIMLDGKTFCSSCADEIYLKGLEKRRSGKLTTGGVFNIIVGVLSIFVGLFLVIFAKMMATPLYLDTNFYLDFSFFAGWLIVVAIISVILGIVAIVGGIYAFRREKFGWALAGGICALLSFWPLGIPALVLISLSKDEFNL
jgi:hypothetical protein